MLQDSVSNQSLLYKETIQGGKPAAHDCMAVHRKEMGKTGSLETAIEARDH